MAQPTTNNIETIARIATIRDCRTEASSSSCGDGSFEYLMRREAEEIDEFWTNVLMHAASQCWDTYMVLRQERFAP